MRSIGLGSYYSKLYESATQDVNIPMVTEVKLDHVYLIIFGYILGILIAVFVMFVEVLFKYYIF